MTVQQTLLSPVLMLLVFSIALDLKIEDFKRVGRVPRGVVCGLLPQFVLLPLGTWTATLLLDLPPQIEVAMILVAACPGGTTSSVITHLGGGNVALSMSISAVGALVALLLTPLNFAWMVNANPDTATWIRMLEIDASTIWVTLMLLLAAPLVAGLAFSYQFPVLTARIRKPLSRLAIFALVAFVLGGLIVQRRLLTLDVLPILLIVVLQNGAGLLLGEFTGKLFRLNRSDRRAVIIEGGMQNAGFALGIVATQFSSEIQMVIFTSLWGVWHSVSGLGLAFLWRRQDAVRDFFQG